jgi:mRNA interferase RelE/StbE
VNLAWWPAWTSNPVVVHRKVGWVGSIPMHLRHEPTKISKSRIKRLRGLFRPQYRLRVGEIRIFYDVSKDAVEVLAIVEKSQSEAWLKEAGESI